MTKIKKQATENTHNKKILKLILMCRKNGMGFGQIANELNQNGFTTVRGKLFYKTTIKRLYEKLPSSHNIKYV